MLLDALILVFVFVIGLQIPSFFRFSQKDLGRLRFLWVYHLIFGYAYYSSVIAQGGSDSLKYWSEAKKITSQQALLSLVENKGTQVMYALNYIPSGILGLDFLTGTIVYSFIGFIGLIFFYKIAIELIPFNYKFKNIFLFPAILFLPNLHFWSVAVGKDTLLFFCVGAFSYALMKWKTRVPLLIFSMLLAYIVRPHIVLFLILSYSLAFLLNNKIGKFQRILLFVAMAAVGVVILPSVMEYAKIEELSVDSYEQFSDNKVSVLSRAHTGSSVDVSNYPLPLKIFTFLYRPTFIDIKSFPALLAAFENLILLILSIMVLRRKPIKTFNEAPFIIKGLMFFLAIGTFAFSMSLGNLGIMLRMRNMFLPGMLIFICYSYSKVVETKIVAFNLTRKLTSQVV